MLLTPSPHGVIESFLGNRNEQVPALKLEPLAILVLAGELKMVVEKVVLDAGMAGGMWGNGGNGPGATMMTAVEMDGTVTQAESLVDLAMHIVAGPGTGSTFVLIPGHRYILGRESSKPVNARRAGVVRLQVAVPDGPPALRHALKRSHVEVAFLTPRERKHGGVEAKYKVTAHGPVGYHVRSVTDEVDLDAIDWDPLNPDDSLLFSYDDLIKAGNVVFLITNNHSVPRKLPPPMLQARSPHDLLISWAPRKADTSVMGFVVRYTSINPASASLGDWRLRTTQTASLLLSDLESATKYWIEVRGRNSAGPGPWSSTISFSTAATWSDDEIDDDDDYVYEEDQDAPDAPGLPPGTLYNPDDPATAAGGATHESGSPNLDEDAQVTAVLGSFQQRDGETLKFVKSKLLGQGGQASVFLGIDVEDGSMYAVKEMAINPASTRDTEQADLLVSTVKLLQNLDSPHIVRYKGVAKSDDTLRIFLEYCPFGSLRSMLDDMPDETGLPELLAAKYTAQILKGIAYLHENAILHRDIKAANVLFHVAGDVSVLKIADFGLAWQSETATGTRGTVGTPYFMSPEAVRNEPPSSAGDIWAVGCTVYEILVGQAPLIKMGDVRAFFFIGKFMTEGHKLPQNIAVSPQCHAFLDAAMKVSPTDRPSAHALLDHEWLSLFSTPDPQ